MSLKLTMLLGLTSAQRQNEIQNLDIRYMTKSGKDYTFPIAGTTKISTLKQRKRKPGVTFHRFSEDDSVCPYKTLEHYLEFTKSWREEGDRNQLLLNHSASTATVACWVK